MTFGYFTTFKLMDKVNIETLGPLGFAFNLQNLAMRFSRIQSGFIRMYWRDSSRYG
jgi:hypothetical protein